ncbi:MULTISPECIES: N-6 DNA methylase [unclassified Caballeronia]|uniref:class I SAM-dependent DNA methyltransferase n=1 Tax=unclassified Caballeronia TaxID=2646786 RepID=UPI002862A333|nr:MULTISPECIES: N-6 DNA methylase [unclassified Caballeronia]MDR5752147.1 N-6 DNA methylase [Caballeronia sp. LZ024]MDR5843712.1 N-6 DNA methylase [Caballeronia sp. LZ031]
MSQLQSIEAIEKRLWSAADLLRANSGLASNEYFMPVMGLIFLRHSYSRYLAVKPGIEANLPRRGGKTRALTKEDFSQQGAIYLRPEAEFDALVALPDSADRAGAIIAAMEGIEADYESLRGVLPKAEYHKIANADLGELLRRLNPEELKTANGDIFGRIYEYFLTQFADQGAHDGGEFFTPISLVQMIVNVIEPLHGRVLDPACGSGGMFVQSAHLVERNHSDPTKALTFFGMEKNATTIRLGQMNLAVHGLQGKIAEAISYYVDPHELLGKADYVMANPPFNVDEVDAEKVKNDPRLPFGLPGVNKAGKVSNGNYLWISYFYSYLSAKGRAGFVMSSQASSAGRDEATVRRQLVETGHVDAMVSIRSNFFYTRTVPCELWFFDKAKPKRHQNHVLMLDARNVYRKVTRKIYDFSPEQLANLTSIVWLYRGQTERFLQLVGEHLHSTVNGALASVEPLQAYLAQTRKLADLLDTDATFKDALATLNADVTAYKKAVGEHAKTSIRTDADNATLHKASEVLAPLAEQSRDLIKNADHLYKLAGHAIDALNGEGNGRELNRIRKDAGEARKLAVEALKQVRYFHRQALWLQERFPEAELRDVPGLVKLVSRLEIEANDWSLTPARYVGVAPKEVDEDFDFEATLKDVHIELKGLNDEAMELAAKIARNFEELGA